MIHNLSDKILEELQRQLAGKSFFIPGGDFHLAVQAVLARVDLVTREEFDVQAAVLARTRARLEILEQQLAQLEG